MNVEVDSLYGVPAKVSGLRAFDHFDPLDVVAVYTAQPLGPPGGASIDVEYVRPRNNPQQAWQPARHCGFHTAHLPARSERQFSGCSSGNLHARYLNPT